MAQPKDFGFGEQERMVRDSARKFLAENAPLDQLRRMVAGDHREAYQSDVPPAAFDESLWNQIVNLGWPSLAVPEEADGAGMNMVTVAAVAEEAGRAALCSPLVSTLLATCVLREATTDAARASLRRIVGGEPATLAVTDERGSWEPADTSVRAEVGAAGVTLDGTAYFVQDARKAAFFIVSARSSGGVGLYVVDASAPGVAIEPDRIVDLTRDQARVHFRNVAVGESQIVVGPPEGAAVLTAAVPALLVIVSADICGAGEWQLQTTTEYARVRTQFGHPLGFFQAVKHPLANMMIDIDRARSLVYNAACAIDTQPATAAHCARMAKACASDMADFCSGRSVQLHGGIGFTWECDVHLYFKRQKHNQLLFGDATYQRAKLADLIDAAE